MKLTKANTLAFLKDLVEQYEFPPVDNQFLRGMDACAYMSLVSACRHFRDAEGTITDDALREFVEAIKNEQSRTN